ncbi:hypothetical protein Forpe1208_v008344 [Fusarium oxysporum f. sp. rapae]|uniref:Uncharacterized protein n=1 Tax=Fusarium oxysporum f. sp. rapae TaxID=485398 RepID=A0A8J5TWU3_FUSOX|nr:hypothetical protein Forpe1208_v008344 [Fusarium oxysporum f. sp. rapae]
MRYTEILALAIDSVAAAQFSTTRLTDTTTSAIKTSPCIIGTMTIGTEITGSATNTATGGIGNAVGFNFLGCFSSENGFPGFTQAYFSEENDADLCAESYLGFNFFRFYDNKCSICRC